LTCAFKGLLLATQVQANEYSADAKSSNEKTNEMNLTLSRTIP
jgi:hypothetical protein